MSSERTESTPDIVIVGGGPVGLAAALAAKRHGLAARVIERGPLCASIHGYPTNMVFFTSNELLEIGGHPLITGGPKATRREALDYYRRVTECEQLDVATHTTVERIEPRGVGFVVATRDEDGAAETASRAVVVATGYYHRPRPLGLPGEELPHVTHYYREAHPHWRRDVVIVGGGNSAAEAALELWRAGARVTMLVRGPELKRTVKYWVRPDVENRIREGSIAAVFGATVTAITPEHVVYRAGDGEHCVRARAVLTLIGYTAEADLVARAGAAMRADGSVVLDPDTFESSIPGLFVVGSAGYGDRTGEVFIENGRLHAAQAVAAIAGKFRP